MIGMQYQIALPDDFDMDNIRERVRKNGHKTDGFPGLLLKAYLIQTRENGATNKYAPLYLWKDSDGMNRFIFDGFYDNILHSFGWQSIHISVPCAVELEADFAESRWLLAVNRKIAEAPQMERPVLSRCPRRCTGRVLLYNPEQWRCTEYAFFKTAEDAPAGQGELYQILHISM